MMQSYLHQSFPGDYDNQSHAFRFRGQLGVYLLAILSSDPRVNFFGCSSSDRFSQHSYRAQLQCKAPVKATTRRLLNGEVLPSGTDWAPALRSRWWWNPAHMDYSDSSLIFFHRIFSLTLILDLKVKYLTSDLYTPEVHVLQFLANLIQMVCYPSLANLGNRIFFHIQAVFF